MAASHICGALRDLVPFVQFKKREKHPWRSANFSKIVVVTKTRHKCVSRENGKIIVTGKEMSKLLLFLRRTQQLRSSLH